MRGTRLTGSALLAAAKTQCLGASDALIALKKKENVKGVIVKEKVTKPRKNKLTRAGRRPERKKVSA